MYVRMKVVKLYFLLPLVQFSSLERWTKHRMIPIIIDVYTWNKTELSPFDYLKRFCPTRCRGEIRVSLDESRCWTLGCLPCYCQRPACEIYNNCCPDITLPYQNYVLEINSSLSGYLPSRNTSIVSDVHSTPVQGCDLVAGDIDTYLYIRSCSSNYTENKTMVDLCERDREKQEETIETFLRVVDLLTHVVYKNMFCAMCNNVEHFTDLTTEMKMDSLFYKARNKAELIKELFLVNNTQVTVTFPTNVSIFDCFFSHDVSNTVNECKVSNQSNAMDLELARACDNLSGKNIQVYDKVEAILYKNIFCAICRKRQYPTKFQHCGKDRVIFENDKLPFSLLLNFKQSSRSVRERSKTDVEKSRCPLNTWQALQGNCVPLFCSAGKKLHNNQCTEILEEIKGLRYRLCLWMVPLYSDRQDMSNNDIFIMTENIIMQLKILLRDLSKDYFLQVQAYKTQELNLSQRSEIYWIDSILLANNSFKRNEFEGEIINLFIDMNISIKTTENESLVLSTYLSSGLEDLNKREKKINFNISNVVMLKNNYAQKFIGQTLADPTQDSILMSNLLLCPHVKFDVTKYKINIDYNFLPPNIRITVDLNVTKINITHLKDFSMVEIDEDGGLNVCQDLLDSKLKADKDNIQQDLLNRKLEGTSLAEYIVSIMCCLASIVCLLLTLLTYFMFPVLRKEAGINNMFLSFSLLLAQISLLVTSHISESSVMCTVIGITTHFLWLWMFSWSFICSYHMFRVFTDNTTRPTSQNNWAGLWKKIVVSLLSAILIVCITILYSYFTSDGPEIGYSRFNCYLNSSLLIGVTVAGPLSVVTMTNIVFYVITVYKINNIRRLQSSLRNDDQQSQWYVYVRLSSVTGLFWTVAIIAEALDSNILKFISIILNGLQGVAIFMSFICNKRVFYLYSDLKKRDNTLNTTT